MSAPVEKRGNATLRELRNDLSTLWWRFVDWIAVVSWPKLSLILFLTLVAFGGILHVPNLAFLFIFLSIGTKVVAGGKRRADIAAKEAAERANIEALERRVVEVQMAALQAQIEPHFLFNTMALIGRLIETDPQEAARIHANLIEYLRSALPQMREAGGSTLGRQVELSRAYLAIMQARMKNRLSVAVDIPPGLENEPFPPMMLQTLVENAIKHGLEPKMEGGRITIRARSIDGFLQVEVIDDGVGFDLHAAEGIGLANLRERLKVLFGGKAQLIIEAPAGGGASMTIRVPSGINGYSENRQP